MNKLLGGILVGACVLSFGAAGCQKPKEPKENAAPNFAPPPPPVQRKQVPPTKLALESDAIDIVLDEKKPVTKKVKVEGPAVKVEGAKDGLSTKLELASGVVLNLIAEPKAKLGKQTLTVYAIGDQKATLTVDILAAGTKSEGDKDKKGDKKPTDKKSDDKKIDDKKSEDRKADEKKAADKKLDDKKTDEKKTSFHYLGDNEPVIRAIVQEVKRQRQQVARLAGTACS